MGGLNLRAELDRIPLWDGDHVRVEQLAEYFAKYLYLPRLKNTQVLVEAIEQGVSSLTWPQDGFAYAEAWDGSAKRYRGLRAGQMTRVLVDKESGVVKPDAAQRQLDAEAKPKEAETRGGAEPATTVTPEGTRKTQADPVGSQPAKLRRFHATIQLDPQRVASGASTIANEVIQHLEGVLHADVEVTLEIRADMPDGAPDHVVRTVTENCRTLKFDSFGFEEQ